MTVSRTGRQPEDGDIQRTTLAADILSRDPRGTENTGILRAGNIAGTFKRSERLATKFGSGKFGVGRFSRKRIIREKNL